MREIVIKLRASPNWVSDLTKNSPTTVRILDCKLGKDGSVQQLVELNTLEEKLDKVLERIRNNPMVIDAYMVRTRMGKAIGRVLTRDAFACRSMMESNLFCRSCFFTSTPRADGTVEWTLAFSDGKSLTQFLNKLESEHVMVEIRKLSKVVDQRGLTPRQQQIITYAMDKGYFDYPRKASLSALAKELKITRSTLLEIIRRAEKKALTSIYKRSARTD